MYQAILLISLKVQEQYCLIDAVSLLSHMALEAENDMTVIEDIQQAPFWGGGQNYSPRHYHRTERRPDGRCKLHKVFRRDLTLFQTIREAQRLGYEPCSYCFG